jgi:site-specific DNA recombinase
MYKCPREHLFRLQAAVDSVAVGHVLTRLDLMEPGERLALLTEDDPGAPSAAEAAEIRRKLELLVDMELDGTITREEHKRRRATLRAQLTTAERKMAAVSRGPVLAEFMSAADVSAAWGALPLDRKRSILHELVEVTILPARPGYTLSRHVRAWNSVSVGVSIGWRLCPPGGPDFMDEFAEELAAEGQEGSGS